MVFLEDAEHLVLVGHLSQLRRMFHRGDAEQQSVVVFLQSEEVHLPRVGEQRTVVVVLIAVDVVVDGVESSGTAEELHLGEFSRLSEHVDHLVGGCFVAMDGQCLVDDALHTLADEPHVVERDGTPHLHVNIIAV